MHQISIETNHLSVHRPLNSFLPPGPQPVGRHKLHIPSLALQILVCAFSQKEEATIEALEGTISELWTPSSDAAHASEKSWCHSPLLHSEDHPSSGLCTTVSQPTNYKVPVVPMPHYVASWVEGGGRRTYLEKQRSKRSPGLH